VKQSVNAPSNKFGSVRWRTDCVAISEQHRNMKPTPIEVLPSKQMQADVVTDLSLLSMAQVAQLSGVSVTELSGLVDYGVLIPVAPDSKPWAFKAACVMTLQRAEALRQDLLLDGHSFALAVMLLNQITGLEVLLYNTRAELCKCREEVLIDRHSG
jgi:hypothetical protein